MEFCDLIKSVGENFKANKTCLIRVVVINALIGLMYLLIPASIKTFMGLLFASASESTSGMYEFLQDNLETIENVISALIAFMLVVASVINILTILSALEKDVENYKVQQIFGLGAKSIICQSMIQCVVLCILWNVMAFVIAELFAGVVMMVFEIGIAISLVYFLIILATEILITIIATIINYLSKIDNSNVSIK